MLELRIMEDGAAVPLGELCNRVVDWIAAEQLAEIIETLIAVLDEAQGDIDLEDGDVDGCSAHDDEGGRVLGGVGLCLPGDDDDAEVAWPEWDGSCPISSDTLTRSAAFEDDEDDDPDSCSDDVGEIEQLAGDVPTIQVYAIEPDPLTGARPFLGMTNLTTAFRCFGDRIASADRGGVAVRLSHRYPTRPGLAA